MVLSRWCFPRNQGRLATNVCSPMNYWRQNGFQSSTIFLRQRPSWDFLRQIIIFGDIWSSTDCWEWLGDHDGAAVVGGEQGWQMEAEVGQPWKTNTGQPAGCGKLLYFLSLAKCISLSLSKVFVWKAQPAGSVVVVTQSAHLLVTSPPRHRYHITPYHWITWTWWSRWNSIKRRFLAN